MKSRIRASVSIIAAAVMLVSCASKGPATSQAAGSEYQALAENASKQIICRRQAVTGSRIGTEVCMTRAQMAEQRQRAAEIMDDIRASAAIARPVPDRPVNMPSGGSRTNP